MRVTIARVDEVLFDGDAESLTVPGSAGEMTVLPGHEPLITTLRAGRITVRPVGGAEVTLSVEDGVLEITGDSATIIL